MNYILRDKSVLTGKNNLESLYTCKNFPVFFGCVDTEPAQDMRADMSWAIDPETGVIQLDKLIPLDILYQSQHVDGTGPTWQKYYQDLTQYIIKQAPTHIMEIGGGQGQLAELFISATKNTDWIVVEPNPLHRGSDRIKIISDFFDKNFKTDGRIDTIVFSQVLEHAYDPRVFIRAVAKYLSDGGKLVFGYPNLKLWLERKYTNALNFEHTVFLTDCFVDYLLTEEGFYIIDKSKYRDHSFFYTVVKRMKSSVRLENKYDEYKRIFLDFIEYHRAIVADLNQKVAKHKGSVYIFGAHIFAQYLFEFGLKQKKIKGLLDNSPLKQGKRLYGTDLTVYSPETLKGQKNTAVVLKVGVYLDEIKEQLAAINPELTLWE